MARGSGEHGHKTACTARSAHPTRGQEDAPGGPPFPPGGIIELTLNFFQAEIDQMSQDACYMARKGLLHTGDDRLSQLTAYIRHARIRARGPPV